MHTRIPFRSGPDHPRLSYSFPKQIIPPHDAQEQALPPESGRASPIAHKARRPHNVMRHSLGSGHRARRQDAARTAHEVGHLGALLLHKHHRNLVTQADAEAHFGIVPSWSSGIGPLANSIWSRAGKNSSALRACHPHGLVETGLHPLGSLWQSMQVGVVSPPIFSERDSRGNFSPPDLS
jgi:hypothetical protein